jgi:beta-glucosidase
LGLSVLALACGVAVAPGARADDLTPYSLPVVLPAADKTSPPVDPRAPYTPTVLDLIHQLEPSNPPTRSELANAAKLLHGAGAGFGPIASVPTCHNVGPVAPPTAIDPSTDRPYENGRPTNPSIAPMCWTDAQGVLNTFGPQARGSTAPMTLMGLAASFDRALGNVWGQTEGREARAFMSTGIFGPQTDLARQPNWIRNLTATGEDPYLSQEMVAAQIHGMQGVGAMSQMKHFAVYNGQNQNANTDVQDQALHENYLTPYEGGFVNGQAAAGMCSYQIFRDTSTHLPASVSSLTQPSPFGNLAPPTWALDESHFACEQPLLLNYILRGMWHSQALIGSDYPAIHSTAAILQGADQDMPSPSGFFSDVPVGQGSGFGAAVATDPTGDTCADANGNKVDCAAAGSTHVGGYPDPSCPPPAGAPRQCTLVDAVVNGSIPLTVFNQALARVLYQQERFGMLGCDPEPTPRCTNPGGVGSDRTGAAPLPAGPTSGTPQLGTKNGDAAVVEKYSEEGATLLKNDGTLPIKPTDLTGTGILVTGAGANHTIADPTGEASLGFLDRNAISPLQQLRNLSGQPGAFTYVPAFDSTGQAVPPSALSNQNTAPPTAATGGLNRTSGPGSPTVDKSLDFTTASTNRLAPGSYTWSGYVYVPTADTYTFELQQSPDVAAGNVTFSLDGTARTLAAASPVYFNGGNGPAASTINIPGTPTTEGYTEGGLTNRQFSAGALSTGFHAVTITFNNDTTGPRSFRFAYTRDNGDINDAAAAAVGKQLAIVFLNDTNAVFNDPGGSTTITNPYSANPPTISAVASISPAQLNLVRAVAARNPNTVVVLNTTNPVLLPFLASAKSVLEMWFSGQEGGTSTARVLLGQANPSGHSSMTWPRNATDTFWAYDQPSPLYPGDHTGPHLERLSYDFGAGPFPACVNRAAPSATSCTDENEGIFTGYRYYDQLGIPVMFPFGRGLSYTSFAFSKLDIAKSGHEADISFDLKNSGQRAGAEVAQVYVGGGPPIAGVQQAVRALRGFQRVELAAGETKRVTIHLDERSFQYWDEASQTWKFNPGTRTIWVGDADALDSLPLSGQISFENVLRGGPGTPPGARPDKTPPRIRLLSNRRQRIVRLRSTGLRFRIGVDEAVRLRVTLAGRFMSRGHHPARGKLRRLARITVARVAAGQTLTVTLKPSAALRRRLRGEKRLPGVLEVRATDLAGNVATRTKLLTFR